MTKDIEQWLGQGEEIYNKLLGEYREIETQIEDLERQLAQKQSEINQVAAIVGKAPMENALRVTASQVVSGEVMEDYGSASANNIARALNGRLGR